MDFISRLTVIVPVSVALTSLFAGCGLSKVDECNKLADAINKGVPILEKYEQETSKVDSTFDGANDPKVLKAAADNFAATTQEGVSELARFGKELKTVELKDEKLKRYRDRYAKLFEDFGNTLHDYGKALSSVGTLDAKKDVQANMKKIEADVKAAEKKAAQGNFNLNKLNIEKNSYCIIK